MPINAGKEGETTYTGLTGNYHARPTTVADKIVEGRDGRPDALRVGFEIKDKDDKATLFVPMDGGAADTLRPFTGGSEPTQTDEAYLRKFIAGNVVTDWYLVYLSNGTVRGVTKSPWYTGRSLYSSLRSLMYILPGVSDVTRRLMSMGPLP